MLESSEETEALVKALVKTTTNLPMAALQLREGEMLPERQHALGSLLIGLGELLHKHAELGPAPAEPKPEHNGSKPYPLPPP
jgi:hypothetical protein